MKFTQQINSEWKQCFATCSKMVEHVYDHLDLVFTNYTWDILICNLIRILCGTMVFSDNALAL